MAMKQCKECKTEISSSAKVCPHCGKEQRNFFQKHVILIVLLILMLFGITIAQTSNTKNEHTVVTNGNSSDNTTKDNSTNTQITENVINIGDTIQGKDWEVTISEINFSQRVDPPETTTGFYEYYQVKDTDNTYLYVILNCKNISNLELGADTVAKVKVKYNDNYTYTSFSTIPDETLGFSYTNITKIKPLTTDKVYFLAEMPNSISTETDTPIEVDIEFENQKYICKYR